MKFKLTNKHPKRKSKSQRKRSQSMTQKQTPQADTLDAKNKQFVKNWNDRSLSTLDRAQMAIFTLCEGGMDYTTGINQLIHNADESGKTDEAIKLLGQEPLVTERYLGPATINGVGSLGCALAGTQYAWVTTRDGVNCLPCDVKDQLNIGDIVLISPKVSRIVGKDGDLASTGSVAVVESIPEGDKGQVIVKGGPTADTQVVAWLHHSLLADAPKPGDKVIYDDRHRFVLSRVSTDTDGKELLSELANLPIVRRAQVGSPHPIADQIINHFKDAIERPEWLKSMGSRDRKGYLFVGQTGGGKSYHIKMIATEVHDLVEQHTGQRTSRVFLCDASNFWSPYFGETEQKINNWAKKIAKLGSQKLTSKEGEELKVPILGVIEECEALFRSRGGDQHASGHLFDRVLSLLLQKLESVEDAIGVPIVWVCSTNRPDLIDAAAMRRIGMRKAIFGNLDSQATKLVMGTKMAAIKNVNAEEVVAQVVSFLYEAEDGQAMAEVSFQGGKKRVLNRRELVTPAILEEAVSSAVDWCISASRESNKLQDVSGDDVVDFLGSHFKHLAKTLTRENLPEHCPEWFAEDATPVTNVRVIR